MKHFYCTILFCCQIFLLSSQVERSLVNLVNGQYKERVSFTIPLYQIEDSIMEEEFDRQLRGYVPQDSISLYFLLNIESRSDEESTYTFSLLFSPYNCQKSVGCFSVHGIDVLFTSKAIPDYLKETSSVKTFSFDRIYYKVKNKQGEECELDIMYEDDGDTWTSILINNHFERVTETVAFDHRD